MSVSLVDVFESNPFKYLNFPPAHSAIIIRRYKTDGVLYGEKNQYLINQALEYGM